MSKITLSWFGTPRDYTLAREDNYEQEYRFRNNVERTLIKVKHTVLKAKAPSGAELVKHDVTMTHETVASPTAFATRTDLTFSFTAADDSVEGNLAAMAEVVASIASSDANIAAMLARTPLPAS